MNPKTLLHILHNARKHGLRKKHLKVMLLLKDNDQATMTNLSVDLNTSSTMLTGIADRLDYLGYTTRTWTAADRRICYLQLTNKGRHAIDQILNAVLA